MIFLKSIQKAKGKYTALVRADLNIEKGDERASLRMDRSLPTIEFLISRGYRVVILSHRGRPLKREKSLSLAPFAGMLSKKLGIRVKFIPFMPISAAARIIGSDASSVFLLENMRFFEGENKDDPAFARELSDLGDVYVNDAFAFSHRKAASISAITNLMPSYAGFLLEKELAILGGAIKNPPRPFTIVLGGVKISDKLPLLKKLAPKADYILLGGGVANTVFHARGIPVGKSVYENNFSADMLKSFEKKAVLPVDTVISGGRILDVGPKTAELFSSILKKSRLVLWNGPVGNTDDPAFCSGSRKVLEAMISSRARVIIGGGETTSFVLKQKKRLPERIFLSTGGGAMLEFLAGKKLPGIAALMAE